MKQLFVRFLRDTRAAVAFEAVIITPILAWLFVGSFVFFDAFRAYNSSIKAAFAVADVLSRQEDPIYATDIEGMADVFQHITRDIEGTSIRVTQVRRRRNDYRIDWSYATDGTARLFNSNLPEIEEQLPIMARGDYIVIVETFLPYRPAFNVGLGQQEFTNFTVTRPRYAPRIEFNDGIEPDYCGQSCDLGEGDGEGTPSGDGDSEPTGT